MLIIRIKREFHVRYDLLLLREDTLLKLGTLILVIIDRMIHRFVLLVIKFGDEEGIVVGADIVGQNWEIEMALSGGFFIENWLLENRHSSICHEFFFNYN